MRNSENVKIFYSKAWQENIQTNIWLKVILQYCPGLFWLVYDIFSLFYVVLAYSSLLQLVMGCSTFYKKKVKAHNARKKMKARKAYEKRRPRKARKKRKAHKTQIHESMQARKVREHVEHARYARHVV